MLFLLTSLSKADDVADLLEAYFQDFTPFDVYRKPTHPFSYILCVRAANESSKQSKDHYITPRHFLGDTELNCCSSCLPFAAGGSIYVAKRAQRDSLNTHAIFNLESVPNPFVDQISTKWSFEDGTSLSALDWMIDTLSPTKLNCTPQQTALLNHKSDDAAKLRPKQRTSEWLQLYILGNGLRRAKCFCSSHDE